MNAYVADTHALLWYLSDSPLLGSEARRVFEETEQGRATILISAITLIEAIYLAEKKKVPPENLKALIDKIQGSVNYLVAPVTFEVAIAIQEVAREKVSDMPDRIIVATTKNAQAKLITRDNNIRRSHIVETIW